MPKRSRTYDPLSVGYRAKFVGNILSRVGGDVDIAKEFAYQSWVKHVAAYSVYSQLYHKYVKPLLVSRGVHPALYGLYRSFAFYVYKHVHGPNDPKLQFILADWANRGLDPDILKEIVAKVFEFKPGKK